MATPRDPSKMGSNSHTGLYTGLAIATIFVIGFLIFAFDQPKLTVSPNAPTAPVTQNGIPDAGRLSGQCRRQLQAIGGDATRALTGQPKIDRDMHESAEC